MSGDRIRAVVIASASTVLTIYGLAGSSRLSGPVLFTLIGSHGVHRDDLLVLAMWIVILGVCWWQWRRG